MQSASLTADASAPDARRPPAPSPDATGSLLARYRSGFQRGLAEREAGGTGASRSGGS
jgi:hypothetical protein